MAPLRSNASDPDSLCFSAEEKAEILQRQFLSVYTREPDGDTPIPEQSTSWSDCINTVEFTVQNVQKALGSQNPSKACGPDGIHPCLVRELSAELAPTIAHLFTRSMNDGQVPSEWKTASVSPIFKKGSKHIAANYRPVSLTCILCKIMETIVREVMLKHILENDLISNSHNKSKKGKHTKEVPRDPVLVGG